MKNRSSILWRIRSDRGADSFLLGSIHVDKSVLDKAWPQIEQNILSTQVLLTETDLTETFQAKISSHHWMHHLSARKTEKWRSIIHSKTGIPLENWNYWPPIFLLNALNIADLHLEFNGQDFVDLHCYRLAEEAGIPSKGIMSNQDHYGILSEIPIMDQVKMLKEYFQNTSKAGRKARKMLSHYRQQEIHKLYRLTSRSLGKFRKLMLIDRNWIMSEKIARKHFEKPCFSVVGASHLSGEKGILHVLKQEYGLSLSPEYLEL